MFDVFTEVSQGRISHIVFRDVNLPWPLSDRFVLTTSEYIFDEDEQSFYTYLEDVDQVCETSV